ncbi:hypothetical protein [Nocardia sp. NPDC050435]|uniref:hypothetical protein n=1 Tax=Nocardia sp. NPDC050435 TaxID=3155040 RepID=UPI0033F0A7DE
MMPDEPMQDRPFTPQPGDVLMVFRLEPGSTASPLAAQDAILAALRQTGVLSSSATDNNSDTREIAEFTDRARLRVPVVARLGRSGWA